MSVRNTIPTRSLWAERVAYTNGMLLDEADFETEQQYHRGRVSMLTRYLHGTGTAAGLNVVLHEGDARKLMIEPGLGVDRAGHVIQSPLALCLDVDHWYEDQLTDNPTVVADAFRTGGDGDPDHFIADIFLGFRECEVAKRPAFESGAFDALGSVAPLRLRDAVEATLVLRTEATPPDPRPNVPPVTGGSFAARRNNLDQQKRETGWKEDIWWDDHDSEIVPDQEHPSQELAADILLARLIIAATSGTPPTLNTETAITIDNALRRMVYSTGDLIALG